MKKIFSILLLTLMLPLQACAAEQWIEGEHYVVLNEESTAEPQVLEFFSFWCPHCYNFESLVAQMKNKFDAKVEFKKVHVNFMGFTSAQIQDEATRAMMIGRALKKDEELNGEIFSHIHVKRSSVVGLNDLKKVFINSGVQESEFDKLANSFAVNSMLQQNKKLQEKYRQYLRGVPNFIVNGKYQAKFTRDMDADDIVNLIVWLSKQP